MGKFVKNVNDSGFKRIINASIISCVISGIIGGIMILFPEKFNNFIGYLVGSVFLLSSIDSIFKFFCRKGAKLYLFNIIFALLEAALGIFIILVPASVNEFITVSVGVFFILLGCQRISYGSWFKVGGDRAWLLTMTVGLFLIGIGIIMFINPFASTALTEIVGTFVLLSKVLEFINLLMVKQRCEAIVKIFW